jgi:hypothetical protein
MAAARIRGERDVVEAAPRYDAYFGMLVISLVATLIALLFLGLDYSSYPAKPPAITKASTNLGSAPAAPVSP